MRRFYPQPVYDPSYAPDGSSALQCQLLCLHAGQLPFHQQVGICQFQLERIIMQVDGGLAAKARADSVENSLIVGHGVLLDNGQQNP